ncbi:sentrin-specific protease 1-like [Venturia canescens]|uniref:sentrin-specific protease 1-like n=1 Tax=Venturia canescens TaxID=32260 RepID=UPI001C9C7D15|nr:sentrin-specific protease 1-like [Venturia canescens]
MDVSTQTTEAHAKVHFGMQTGEVGVWEQSERSEVIKEVEQFEIKRDLMNKVKCAKQSTGTQTPGSKNKGTQVFMWRLIPIDVDETRKPDRQRLEQFVQSFQKIEQISQEFVVPEILSPIRDPQSGVEFKFPMSAEEWIRKKREDEKQERKRYRREVERNGKQWTNWKIGEFNWEDEGKENEKLNDNADEQQKRRREESNEENVERKEKTIKKMKKETNTGTNRKNENIETEREANVQIQQQENIKEEKKTENVKIKNQNLDKKESKGGNKGRKIKEEDLETLDGRKWLNDEVINGYLELIVEKYEKTFAFSTFFFSRLLSGGFSVVRRWTRKFNIFDFDLVLIPLHLGAHWCLATIDLRNCRVNYFDSLMGNNKEYPTLIFEYLMMEAASKQQTSFDSSKWSIVIKKDIPRQTNNFDCGVFVCSFAEYEAAGREIDFCQNDMAAKRQIIKNRLIAGKIE